MRTPENGRDESRGPLEFRVPEPIILFGDEVPDESMGIPMRAKIMVADWIRSELIGHGFDLDQLVFSGYCVGAPKVGGDFDHTVDNTKSLQVLAQEAQRLQDEGVDITDPDRFAAVVAEIVATKQAKTRQVGTHQYYFSENQMLEADQYNPLDYAATVNPVVGVYRKADLLTYGREVHEASDVWVVSGTEDEIASAMVAQFIPNYVILDS